MFFNRQRPQSNIARYAHQVSLPEIAREGQGKLAEAKVLIVGLGALGCPAAVYLAAAGIGTLGVIDDDAIELTHLQRQILYTEEEIGEHKAHIVKNKLKGLNSAIRIIAHKEKLSPDNVARIINNYHLVLNGCDNSAMRYLLNDACFAAGIPFVDGSANRFVGQITLFDPNIGPCYHCLYPEPPSETELTCEIGGVLGSLAGMIGSLQALEAIKHILKIGDSLAGRLLIYDALKHQFQEMRFQKDPSCAVCSRPSLRASNGENPRAT